jgi:hypothetical protein
MKKVIYTSIINKQSVKNKKIKGNQQTKQEITHFLNYKQ